MAVEVDINGNTTNLDAKLAETRRKIKETAEQGSSAASAAGSALGAVSGELGALGGAVGAAGSMIAQLAMGPIGMVTAAITALVTAGIDAWQNLTQSAEEYGSVLDKLADKYDELQKKNDDKKKSSESYMERISAIDARGNLATDAEKKERTQLLALLARNYGGQQEGESRGAYFSRIRDLAIQTETKDAIRQYGSAKRQTSFAIDSAADSIGIGKWWEKDALRNLMKGLSPEQLSEFAYKKMHQANTQGEIDAWEKLAKAARNEAEKKRELDNLNQFGSRSEADVADRMRKESDAALKAQQDAAAKAKAEKDAAAAKAKAEGDYLDAVAKAKGVNEEMRRKEIKHGQLLEEIEKKKSAAASLAGADRLKAEKEIFELSKKELELKTEIARLAQEEKKILETAAAERSSAEESLAAAKAKALGGDAWKDHLTRELLKTSAQIQKKEQEAASLAGADRLKAEKEIFELKKKAIDLSGSLASAQGNGNKSPESFSIPGYMTNDLTRRGGGIGLAVPEREIADINRQILEQSKLSNGNQRDILNALNSLGVRI